MKIIIELKGDHAASVKMEPEVAPTAEQMDTIKFAMFSHLGKMEDLILSKSIEDVIVDTFKPDMEKIPVNK